MEPISIENMEGTSTIWIRMWINKISWKTIEYRYIDNLNELQQRLYYIYAHEKAGNNNFHNERIGTIKFINDKLENMSTLKLKV